MKKSTNSILFDRNTNEPLFETEVNSIFYSDAENLDYLMDLCYQEMHEHDIAVKCNNENLFKVIIRKLGRSFVRDLKDLNEFNDSNLGYYIAKKPKGNLQKESDLRVIKEIYVEQWSVGMEGDSFAGNISVEISKNQFIIMPFSC
ncbi:MAG: hypothetical protein ACK4IZ_03305 [Flavobacterium sp.]|uniref:hypothetical protein n=1 Tax=Flavobacterium sp. TaxID=239 RepID=UPI00391C8C88